MRALKSIAFVVAVIGLRCLAEEQPYTDAEKAARPAAVNAQAPVTGTYDTARAQESIELNGQLRLLAELVRDHSKKLDEARAVGQSDKAGWEGGLLQELRDRMTAIAKSLAVGVPTVSGSELSAATNTLQAATPSNPNELAYLVRLEARLTYVRKQIAELLEASQAGALELQTNNAASTVAGVSRLLEEHRKDLKELDRELSDLELRRLEFNARRKD